MHDKLPKDPTPTQIQAMTSEIREKWTDVEYYKRSIGVCRRISTTHSSYEKEMQYTIPTVKTPIVEGGERLMHGSGFD